MDEVQDGLWSDGLRVRVSIPRTSSSVSRFRICIVVNLQS